MKQDKEKAFPTRPDSYPDKDKAPSSETRKRDIDADFLKSTPIEKKGQDKEEVDFPGYPSYPKNEDAYTIWKEEPDLDPEDPTEIKTPNDDGKTLDTREFVDEVNFDELDVPGSELDDEMEDIGSEDEENNYYSKP